MQTLILSLHVIVCVTLVILVLLQAGKEGMGVIFGGGNASVLGSCGRSVGQDDRFHGGTVYRHVLELQLRVQLPQSAGIHHS